MSSMSNASEASLSRYRPALLAVLAGVSVTYAIYLIRKNYTTWPESQISRGTLQRHGAVRRRPSRNRRRALSISQARAQGRVEQAMRSLQVREDEGLPYAHCVMEASNGQTITCDLIPSRIPTVAQILEQNPEVTLEDAGIMRSFAERQFMAHLLPATYGERPISQLEENYLRIQLLDRNIGYEATSDGIAEFNRGRLPESRAGPSIAPTMESDTIVGLDGNTGNWVPADELPEITDAATLADDYEGDDWLEAVDGDGTEQPQGLQNLVYQIAKDQANREGYIHRGVSCNSCGTMPIRGVRYRCANCSDYDLCEDCEAMGVHIKTHLFFKVRIPAQFLGNSRPSLPVFYPGKPGQMPRNLPELLSKHLKEEYDFENHDLDAMWDQFRVLAATEWAEDPNKLGMAIDRKVFDKTFVPLTAQRPPAPNLIYDRMFDFYDTDKNGLIGFEEFLSASAALTNTARDEKLRRIFAGYDLDGDGYVTRKDFLRMFRAWFVLQRELTKDAVAGLEDDFLEGGVREVVMSSQPISSAFTGHIPPGYGPRSGVGKVLNDHGDLVINDGQGALRENIDPVGDRWDAIADAADPSRSDPLEAQLSNFSLPQRRRQSSRDTSNTRSSSEISDYQPDGWPPLEIEDQDIVNALGAYVPLEEVMDAVDRFRVRLEVETRLRSEEQKENGRHVRSVQEERWRRRHFYVDEEEGTTAPLGYTEDDSSEEDNHNGLDPEIKPEIGSRPLSPRSRSSSKVRFEDDVTDTEYETRSNASSRSVPIGERWGGYEITEPEKDIGKDILYLTVQQGFNDLLDDLFKEKEDLAMEARATKREREMWKSEISLFEAHRSTLKAKSVVDTENAKPSPPDLKPSQRTLPDLLLAAGYSTTLPIQAHAGSGGEHEGQTPMVFGPEDFDADGTTPEASLKDSIDHQHNDMNGSSDSSALLSGPLGDPTLPQFRPDTPSPTNRLPNKDVASSDHFPIRTTSMLPDNPKATTQLKSRMPELEAFPTDVQLEHWSELQAYDAEVAARGGKEGTLNYMEFLKKMVGDDAISHLNPNNHEHETSAQDGVSGGDDLHKPDEEGRQSQRWANAGTGIERMADGGSLGRLGFLGSWIDMVSV